MGEGVFTPPRGLGISIAGRRLTGENSIVAASGMGGLSPP